jgi:hypothetical protein
MSAIAMTYYGLANTDSSRAYPRLTRYVKVRALFEEAEAFRTRPDGTKKIFEGTGQYTFINISGVTGVGSFVAARKLGLITAFVRSLLNGDVVWYRKPDICVALIADTVADALDAGWVRGR